MESKNSTLSCSDAEIILKKLLGLPLRYGIKSPDMFFYDVGFGECNISEELGGIKRLLTTYAIHSCCCIKIIDRENKKRSHIFSGQNTS